MTLSLFSRPVQQWFEARLGTPTAIQLKAWREIHAAHSVLVSAPTGAGKSLAAWLPLLDRLLTRPRAGRGVRVLYISPLRALSRDMANSLLELLDHPSLTGLGPEPIRIGVRTGDSSPSERAHQRRQPPDVLLTTPESLFVLLGTRAGRGMLASVESVVLDEVHALIGDKRGTHLSISLERLECLVGHGLQRIGLSATARPLEAVARYLCGRDRDCRIVDWGEPKAPVVHLECPPWPMGHLAGPMHWEFVNQRLIELSRRSGSLLIFCNTRAMVERLGQELAAELGEDQLAVHHGSLGIERRREVEQGLKSGRLRVVVCTASLELGIDIGPLDRVCQIGMCQSINSFRQRAGRARHRPGEVGAIHVFPLSLTDLLDFEAAEQALRSKAMDLVNERAGDLDVLTQQLIALVANGDRAVSDLHRLLSSAWPYRALGRDDLERLIDMLHDGYVRGRETGQGPLLRVAEDELESQPLADRLSLLNSGTIPEWFEYDVVDAKGRSLGRLDEEFAFESAPGQVLSLGGQSWRIQRIRGGQVQVEACEEVAPNLPFWFGDGAGRSPALSQQIAAVCHGGQARHADLRRWLEESRHQLGALPSTRRVILERFYDPGGDQHVVIHSPFGARLNRAWGLALRKRFCRNFNFELQAAATDNGVLISLGAVHSFALEEVPRWLRSEQIRDVLTQALLDTPIFQTRLRWCANTALAVARRDLRGKVPAQIQRNQTENFIARVFPDQLACLENLSGKREIPDHPLVDQALIDCLDDHMDLPGLIDLIAAIERGELQVSCADRETPSSLAEALIHAPRNSFLDPAAAEERRTRTFEERGPARGSSAVLQRSDRDLSTRDGLLASLLRFGFLTAREGERLRAGGAFKQLLRECLAVTVRVNASTPLWVAMERLPQFLSLWPNATVGPFVSQALKPAPDPDRDEALCRLLVGRIRFKGKVGAVELRRELGLDERESMAALLRLESEGLLDGKGEGAERVWRERKALATL
jgi:ATP-dependent Lhr-like helicase